MSGSSPSPQLLTDGKGGYYANVPGGQYRVIADSETYLEVSEEDRVKRGYINLADATLKYRKFWRAEFHWEKLPLNLGAMLQSPIPIYTGDSVEGAKAAISTDHGQRRRLRAWLLHMLTNEPPQEIL